MSFAPWPRCWWREVKESSFQSFKHPVKNFLVSCFLLSVLTINQWLFYRSLVSTVINSMTVSWNSWWKKLHSNSWKALVYQGDSTGASDSVWSCSQMWSLVAFSPAILSLMFFVFLLLFSNEGINNFCFIPGFLMFLKLFFVICGGFFLPWWHTSGFPLKFISIKC